MYLLVHWAQISQIQAHLNSSMQWHLLLKIKIENKCTYYVLLFSKLKFKPRILIQIPTLCQSLILQREPKTISLHLPNLYYIALQKEGIKKIEKDPSTTF